jgi:hypothetical protein
MPSRSFAHHKYNRLSLARISLSGGAACLSRIATIGIWEASPDGRTVYVALSGTPIAAPPQLDAKGNPVFQKAKDDDDDDAVKSDKSADSIAVLDVAARKMTGKISAGSDPEEISLSLDGTKLSVCNEDVKTASVIKATAVATDITWNRRYIVQHTSRNSRKQMSINPISGISMRSLQSSRLRCPFPEAKSLTNAQVSP